MEYTQVVPHAVFLFCRCVISLFHVNLHPECREGFATARQRKKKTEMTQIWIDQQTALHRMNTWGKGQRPFLFLTDYLHRRWLVEYLDRLSPSELLFAFPGYDNIEGKATATGSFTWHPHPPAPDLYQKEFEAVHRQMLAGNSYLTNLTCRIPVETDLTMRDICLRAKARYRLWVSDCFVCFSPETFLRIDHEGTISCCPMKGTISCRIPQAAEVLMADSKEAAEHATIVDLIRNDLSRVADHVKVRRYRYIERLETNQGPILQTSSEITGRLPSDYRSHLGDILLEQLPAGSITGAPKPKTMDIIRQAEGYEREFYTGVAGLCHDGQMDSCVLIRFIDQEDGQLFFKAGGGITAKSDWRKEYQEIIEKTYVPFC